MRESILQCLALNIIPLKDIYYPMLSNNLFSELFF